MFFEPFAKDWWDFKGTFKVLHDITPLRLEFILKNVESIKGKRILDVGCGGGLLTEPLARLGAEVVGVDEVEEATAMASDRAKRQGLPIQYFNTLDRVSGSFDILILSEVLEHVEDKEKFLEETLVHLAEGGALILTTLNKTWQSKVFGVWAAEYLLKWAPPGTHSWEAFISPQELVGLLHERHVETYDVTGLNFSFGNWKLGGEPHINYFLYGVKQPSLK